MPSLNLRNPLRRDPDRPTLKQRAATLKATAARLMRKPAPAAPATALEAVDWHNPPPSFMAFPAIEPGGFVRIERGLPLEVGRLLGIARDELARRMERSVPGETEADRQRREAEHRARLLIPALTAAADPDSAGAEALAALDATTADAELIALGRRYDALHAVWREAEDAGRELFARRDAALAVASAGNADPIKAHEAAWALPGVREAYDRAEKALVALAPICEAIRVQPARTLAGLAVKARANICETWPGGDFELSAALGEDEDSPMRGVRSLIEACCGAAGVDWQGRPQGRAPAAASALGLGPGDVELIALGRAFDVATIRDRKADDAASAAEDRAETRMPKRPACLAYREEDAPFGLREQHCHPSALVGLGVTPNDIAWMTRRPAQREIWVDAPAGSKGSNMVPGKVPQIIPWPEAQTRIDEIVAAWDAHEAERERIRSEEGVREADEAAERTGEAVAALARQIAAMPARTADGMRVKLRVAAFYGVCDPDASHSEAGYAGEAAIRSLYRDTPGIEISTDPSDIRIVPEAVGAVECTPSLSDQIIAGWREWAACCGPDETDADRAAWERVTEQRDTLLDAAEALPPTLENLPAKALALAWLDYVQEWERGREREAYDIPGSLAIDIDTAIVGRFRLVGHFRGA